MKRHRSLCLFLALSILISTFGMISIPTQSVAFENTYVNTGNQRADIVGVALTQLGYSEGPDNDTKYGTWCELPYQPWCATFVSWCAEMADISPSVIRRTGWAHPENFGIIRKSGSSYTPLPGDLFFTNNYSHVGIVYYVEGDYFYTIEGNSNNNGSDEGTGVFSNKRLIRNFIFGIPDYKGTDPAHSYTSGQDAAHPHKRYYQCSHCDERYYTGSEAFDADCQQCTACGCSGDLAGRYICTTTDTKLRIRSGHGTHYNAIGSIPPGGIVQVYAATQDGWAHIRYEAYTGYVSMEYLHPIPDDPAVHAQSVYYSNEQVHITWDSVDHADSYQLTLLSGTTVLFSVTTANLHYCFDPLPPGEYTVQVTAVNKAAVSTPGLAHFHVPDCYTVTFDPTGGTNAPAFQTKQHGLALTLTEETPVRDGYVFLGWSDTVGSTVALYRPGDLWTADQNVTLYAVWRAADAYAQALELQTLPFKTLLLPDEAPDPTGMVLYLRYSDGSAAAVTEGYTFSPLTGQLGAQSVTINYEGLSVTYPIQVVAFIPGDCNSDRFVTEDDAIYLLRHILFPEAFEVSIPTDLNQDAQTNEDDAIYLLRHVLFPDTYPLSIS